MEDRRKHQRFKLRDSCIINRSEVVGTIVDISMGGMACTCFDQNRCHQGFLQQMDIYCRNADLWAEKLDVRILASETAPGMFAEEFSVRKCRLQFAQLTETQAGQLEKLILHAVLP
jgi:hypothetical protein